MDATDSIEYRTAGGVRVTRAAEPCEPGVLDELVAAVAHRRGGVLSSGMEYPGRYSRWHLAYADPCVEVVARGRRISARALNARGLVVMPVLRRTLLAHGTPVDEPTAAPAEDYVEVLVPEGDGDFTEEERSRRPTVFSPLRDVIAEFGSAADPHLGLYGAFGYDLAFQFEPVRRRLERGADARDLVLHLPDALIVRDRKRETCVRYTYEFTVDGQGTEGLPRETGPAPATRAPAELPPEARPGAYAEVVRDAKERFVRGDLFEVVPGHVMYAPCSDPAAFYERLRRRNPAPYEFFFNLGDGEHLVGASPEMYVRVTGDRVETCPISGTIRRGADPLEDAENIRTLLTSAKEESELTMCTDVDRNDKSRICVPGSVKVIGRRQIEMYSRLIHTVDHIEGRLRPGFDAIDAFLTHMWAVTVTGAPKTWAMQFIEDHEETPRRWYGGAVGFLGFDGSMNTGLTLRTAQIRGGVAAVRAGATLLYDSDPDAEEQETRLKARALLETLREGEEPPSATPTAGAGVAAADGADAPGEGMSVLLVDHEDSFVNTLADYFRRLGAEVTTLRHGFPPALLDRYAPDLVVLSPGPGRPEDFDCAGLLKELDVRGLPVFGVCLGLQAMVEHTGGELALLPAPVHGKPGRVGVLDGAGLLAGLGEEFTAARYHSLHATPDRVRGDFTVTATTPDGAVMAIEDPDARRWAVQFHPESILSASGRTGERLIANVLTLVRAHAPAPVA
ncbi:MAG: anthranilate synthase component I [Streptosporangiales bacterium]|nr:anthranilate synthase component I [Streptosporangiales bacterium]